MQPSSFAFGDVYSRAYQGDTPGWRLWCLQTEQMPSDCRQDFSGVSIFLFLFVLFSLNLGQQPSSLRLSSCSLCPPAFDFFLYAVLSLCFLWNQSICMHVSCVWLRQKTGRMHSLEQICVSLFLSSGCTAASVEEIKSTSICNHTFLVT